MCLPFPLLGLCAIVIILFYLYIVLSSIGSWVFFKKTMIFQCHFMCASILYYHSFMLIQMSVWHHNPLPERLTFFNIQCSVCLMIMCTHLLYVEKSFVCLHFKRWFCWVHWIRYVMSLKDSCAGSWVFNVKHGEVVGDN